MSQNLSSAAVMIGALRVKSYKILVGLHTVGNLAGFSTACQSTMYDLLGPKDSKKMTAAV